MKNKVHGFSQIIWDLLPEICVNLCNLRTIEGEQHLLAQFRAEDEAFFKTVNETGNATAYFFTCQLDDFCRAIREGRVPAVSGEDGREMVRFIETLLKKAPKHHNVSAV